MPTEQEQQEQEQHQHSAGDVETAGALLRRTREERGLDEKQVADQLRITVHYVKAIEADNYDKLPGTIFARGYLKSYAGLLSLDAADIVARYEAATGVPQHTRSQPESPQTAGGNSGMRWALASIAAFVVLIVGIWVVSGPTVESTGVAGSSGEPAGNNDRSAVASSDQTRSNPFTAVERDIANEPTLPVPERPAGRAVSSSPLMPAAEPGIEPDSQQESAGTAPESAVTAAQDVAPETDPAALADAESPALALAAEATAGVDPEAQGEADVSPDSTAEAAADAASGSAGQARDQEPAVAAAADSGQTEEQVAINLLQGDNGERIIKVDASGPDVLRISFSGESWVEVNDADQRLIYRDLRESGDVLEVSGRAPFNILLGDAPLTSLRLNGTAIDVSDEIRIDNSARLTVGL